MTKVRETQHRLLVERLDGLAGSDCQDVARLAAAGYVLLTLHRVGKAGRCRHCYRSRWWARRRRACAVLDVFATAMIQPFDLVMAWQEDHGGILRVRSATRDKSSRRQEGSNNSPTVP